MSSPSHIEWEDRRYVPAALSPTKTGQAIKWRLTEALMDLLAQEKLEPGTAVVLAEEEVKSDGGELDKLRQSARSCDESTPLATVPATTSAGAGSPSRVAP